jgi:hypothetical protein
MWAAVQARSKTAAKSTGTAAEKLQRQFVYDRFLARLFTSAPDGTWVLKGGTALLARVRSARHSRDIDLHHRDGTLGGAIAELRTAAAIDLDDHFRFAFGPGTPTFTTERPGQPGSELATLKVDAYAGVRRLVQFSVDIVTGSIITSEPERLHPEPTISLAGQLTGPPYLLYPVADHIADKVCATFERYGAAQMPSSRVRDLVDLVVLARTQRVEADALRAAVDAERAHRRLAPITGWACPSRWAADYATVARDVAECAEHPTFAVASDFVGTFLDPVLGGGLTGATWDPVRSCWARE